MRNVLSLLALLATVTLSVATAGCGAESRAYDIAPIFPLSVDKCAKYDGEQSGSGPTESCMVTQSECKKAAADWRREMQDSAVNDAIMFSCD